MDYATSALASTAAWLNTLLCQPATLVPLGDADPINASTTIRRWPDPYHAIKLALPHLNGGGKYALVIGLGGLGLSVCRFSRPSLVPPSSPPT